MPLNPSMYPSAGHLDLAPPRQGRWLGPMGLALIAHALLIAALTWGVGWQHDAPQAVFEAELWSALPQQAAPRATAPPPAPAPPKPDPQPPAPSEAEIATAQAKKKAEALEKLRLEKEQKEREKRLAEKAAEEKAAAEKRAAADRQRKLQAEKAAAEKRQEQARQEQIERMMGQAGATGAPRAIGTAARSSGPSPGYAGRIAARIKPNVVFTDPISGNPRAEVEVRTLPDGSIASRRIVKSSGSPAWDEAVLRAIDRTGSLPRDTDGSVPSSLTIGLRPQD